MFTRFLLMKLGTVDYDLNLRPPRLITLMEYRPALKWKCRTALHIQVNNNNNVLLLQLQSQCYTTEPTSVTQDSTDTIERKASI